MLILLKSCEFLMKYPRSLKEYQLGHLLLDPEVFDPLKTQKLYKALTLRNDEFKRAFRPFRPHRRWAEKYLIKP